MEELQYFLHYLTLRDVHSLNDENFETGSLKSEEEEETRQDQKYDISPSKSTITESVCVEMIINMKNIFICSIITKSLCYHNMTQVIPLQSDIDKIVAQIMRRIIDGRKMKL